MGCAVSGVSRGAWRVTYEACSTLCPGPVQHPPNATNLALRVGAGGQLDGRGNGLVKARLFHLVLERLDGLDVEATDEESVDGVCRAQGTVRRRVERTR